MIHLALGAVSVLQTNANGEHGAGRGLIGRILKRIKTIVVEKMED